MKGATRWIVVLNGCGQFRPRHGLTERRENIGQPEKVEEW